MSVFPLESLTQSVVQIAKQAGVFLLNELGKVSRDQIEAKSLNSLVSYVDKTTEGMIVENLKKLLPEAGFITEEETVAQSKNSYHWIIDPLDGTTNFLFGLPCFAVSIALARDNELLLGVVLEPNRDECFYAWKDGGAWCNDKKITCRKNALLEQSLLATGFPYHDFSKMDQYLKLFTELASNTYGIRRWGAAAVDLAYVACGRYDGFFEYGLNSWDIAAGVLIIKEAGGSVSDFKGQNNFLANGNIVAASQQMHSVLLEKVKVFMKEG